LRHGLTFGREERRKKKNKAEIVEDLIEKVEQKLGEGDVKASLADYIRLVQLQRELELEEPKEITVRWVEPETEKETDNDAKS
jgi:signal recognition particle GTPase